MQRQENRNFFNFIDLKTKTLQKQLSDTILQKNKD